MANNECRLNAHAITILETDDVRRMKTVLLSSGAIAFAAIIGLAFFAGVLFEEKAWWPAPQLMIGRTYLKSALGISTADGTDIYGRLLSYPGKRKIACPPQDKDTAVIVVAGQSNAANYQGQRFENADGMVVNYINGDCYVAASPLLGADGNRGESWTLLGNQLISSGLYRRVIIAPASVGNTSVSRWAHGGDLNKMLKDVVQGVGQNYSISFFLWHQGEADFLLKTDGARYRSMLESMIDDVHEIDPAVPIFISRASFLDGMNWEAGNQIWKAQNDVLHDRGVFAGPDTDSDVKLVDRYDGTHFANSGQIRFVNDWLDLIRKYKAGNHS